MPKRCPLTLMTLMAALVGAACGSSSPAQTDAGPAGTDAARVDTGAALDTAVSDAPAADAAATDTAVVDTAATDGTAVDAAPGDGSGPDAEVADADLTDAPGFACPYVDKWGLTSLKCGANDLTTLWTTLGITTSAKIKQRDAGGCLVTIANESAIAPCSEVEDKVWIYAGTPDTWHSESQGISSCIPDACTFSPQDAPCAVGDRMGTTTTVTVTVVEDDAGVSLEFTETNDDLCPGDIMTFTWEPA